MRPPRPLPRRPRSVAPHALRRLVLLAIALAAGACFRHGRAGATGDDDRASTPLPEFVVVSVENHNWNDIIVSLVHADGHTTRIGTVTGSTNGVLRFPGQYIAGGSSLQLVARAIGGRTELRSERFTVQPGQQVTWTLETSLARSSLAVY